MDANPVREMPLAEPQKRRARQLAFMLMMHTKDRALQMITKLSDPANGFVIWRPGRVGAGTQRTVPSDADAVVAVSVYGRQRSGLGGVGTTRATV